jgi:altronate hydrolase
LKTMKIHPSDNVAVALEPLQKGEAVAVGEERILPVMEIPAGHKVCLRPVKAGEPIVKYGFPIGYALRDILPGEHVHTQNVKTGLGELLEYQYQPDFSELPPRPAGTFQGYRRPDGRVGIRNEIWILPTVGCVNMVAKNIEKLAQKYVSGTVEGIYAFTHPYGCSQMSEDHVNTRDALCRLVCHPNAGGVLVLGLGCEYNHVAGMKEVLGDYDERRVRFLVCQETEDEVADALALIEELAGYAASFQREPAPMSELVVGLKCGGSDGFSGLTANPLVGAFSDRLVAEGGTTILTEVPEMFGAETILMNRCRTPEVFQKTVSLINDFKEYFIKHDQVIYENPSPGNKAGGISTLEDKSLGCTQKGGRAPVEDVLRYTEPVKKKGLNLLQAPGNDLVASSAEAIGGAQLVLFTTGRGTPFGSPVPTVKISTNTPLYRRKKNWIDFNAGRLLEGVSMEELCEEFYEYVRALASGEVKTRTEEEGMRDLAIFKNGVTL